MGRPRIHRTNADRQRAYRERQKVLRPPQDPRVVDLNRRVINTFEKVNRG